MILINDEKKIIFITSAKCASTSAKNIFIDYSNIESYDKTKRFKAHLVTHRLPITNSQIRINIPVDRDEFKEYLKIQFYRNPYERAVSCYLHHKHGKEVQHTAFSKLARSNPDLAALTGKTYEKYKCKLKCENFKKFLKLRIKGIKPADCLSCYNHSASQFVTKEINELINIKHIEKGIERINKKYKINLKNIVCENHSHRKRGYNYKDYLTPENKKLIRKAFKKDFELNKNFI